MLERIKQQKERFMRSRSVMQDAHRENKLRAVRCGIRDHGCRVQTRDGSFIITPRDIESMDKRNREAFEDIFDELLQEV